MGCALSKEYAPPFAPKRQTAPPATTSTITSSTSLLAKASAPHLLQASALFHGTREEDIAQLAQLCDCVDFPTPQSSTLYLGNFSLQSNKPPEEQRVYKRGLVGEHSTWDQHYSNAAAAAAASNHSLLSTPTASPKAGPVVVTTARNSQSSHAASWRRSFLSDQEPHIAWEVKLHVQYEPAWRLNLACLSVLAAMKPCFDSIMTRARFRDPASLSKLWMFAHLLGAEHSAFCAMLDYCTLNTCCQREDDENLAAGRRLCVIIDGQVDLCVNGVVVDSLGSGSVLFETAFLLAPEKTGLEQAAAAAVTTPPSTSLKVKRDGVALCIDAHEFHQILPHLALPARMRVEDEVTSRQVDTFRRSFAPWFNHVSDAWCQTLIEYCTCLVLQEREELTRLESFMLVKAGSVSVSHSMKRKSNSSSGALIWARDKDLVKQGGDALFTKSSLDYLLLPETTTTASDDAEASLAIEEEEDDFEIRALANDTRIYSIPVGLVKACLQANPLFAADFELRLLKDQAKLDSMLIHPVALFFLRQYLDSVQATENLDFWLEAKEFALGGDAALDLNEQAEALFAKFVSGASPKQINLPDYKRKQLEQCLNRDVDETSAGMVVTRDLFQAAANECYSLIYGCLHRFYRSESGIKLFHSIAIGLSLDECKSPSLPPLHLPGAALTSPHKHRRESGNARRLNIMTTGGSGGEGGSWRLRSNSGSFSSPRLSFVGMGASAGGGSNATAAALREERRSSLLSSTPKSHPAKSPLSGMADVRLED